MYGNDFTHTSVTENNNDNQYITYGSDYYSPTNGNKGGCINDSAEDIITLVGMPVIVITKITMILMEKIQKDLVIIDKFS